MKTQTIELYEIGELNMQYEYELNTKLEKLRFNIFNNLIFNIEYVYLKNRLPIKTATFQIFDF